MAEQKNYMPELCHLSALAGYVVPLGHILGPLAIWLWKRNENPAVEAHGREALNFRISMTLYAALAVVPMTAAIVLPIIAGGVWGSQHFGPVGALFGVGAGLLGNFFMPILIMIPILLIFAASSGADHLGGRSRQRRVTCAVSFNDPIFSSDRPSVADSAAIQ